MIRKILRKNKIKNVNFFVEPDEIFLDSKNLENFNQQQFEGRIEKPIPKKNILFLGFFFLLCILVFGFRMGNLSIAKGNEYLKRSLNNTLQKDLIFAERGIIYDRNKKELAWNDKITESRGNTQAVLLRTYFSPGFSHVLGYVSYPAKDKSGFYWQTEFIGKDGLEKEYNDLLKGENGLRIVETDAHGVVHSENTVNIPKRGKELISSLDSRIQEKLYKIIEETSINNNFQGGSGVIMDVETGEILTSTSFPEYDSKVLSLGENREVINGYLKDKRKVFLDRTISGLYTPGSIVKPFFALGALVEGIISPEKQILSTGSISVPNPYFPGQDSVFKDWKAHGWVDMKHAIAVSSDVYFYEIGGGFEGQKGLGIANLEKYAKMFGIGQSTNIDLPDEVSGLIPNPEWKLKNFKGDPWRIGDTYNTSIGQYGFQVTPMEMVRAIGAIANYGKLVTPHFLLGDIEKEKQTEEINLDRNLVKIIHEGMRMTSTIGTASILNVPYVEIASKTGTAQIGAQKNRVNSWIVGFFPYQNPKYAFVIMMESGPTSGVVGASSIAKQLFDWMSIYTPEYFK